MNAQPQTHYPAATVVESIVHHTLAVIVDNEPGVLARVIGLFSGRGYNIDSLTVSETEHEKHLSRITIVTRGTSMVIEQIKHQLERLVPVHRVIDMTIACPSIQRELAMVKVRGKGEVRVEALRLGDAFRARVIDATIEATEAAMRKYGKPYEPHVFAGAGHGFLRAQGQQDGANLRATEEAWPMTVAFLRRFLAICHQVV